VAAAKQNAAMRRSGWKNHRVGAAAALGHRKTTSACEAMAAWISAKINENRRQRRESCGSKNAAASRARQNAAANAVKAKIKRGAATSAAAAASTKRLGKAQS